MGRRNLCPHYTGCQLRDGKVQADREGSSSDAAPGMAPQRCRAPAVVHHIAVVLTTCCREQSQSSGQMAWCGPHTFHSWCHLQCSAHRYIWRDLWINTYHKHRCTYWLSGLSSRLFVLCSTVIHMLFATWSWPLYSHHFHLGCFHLFLFLAVYKTILQLLSMQKAIATHVQVNFYSCKYYLLLSTQCQKSLTLLAPCGPPFGLGPLRNNISI